MHPCCQLGPETADFHESNENLVKETFKCYEKYLPGRIFKPFKVFKSIVQSKAKAKATKGGLQKSFHLFL